MSYRSTHKQTSKLADVPSKRHCQAVNIKLQFSPPFHRFLSRTVPNRSVLGMESIFPGSQPPQQQTLSTTDEDDDGEERASDFHFIFECSHILYELLRREEGLSLWRWRGMVEVKYLNFYDTLSRLKGGNSPLFGGRISRSFPCRLEILIWGNSCQHLVRGEQERGSSKSEEAVLWNIEFLDCILFGVCFARGDSFANRMRVNLKLWKIRRSDEDAAIAADLKRQ